MKFWSGVRSAMLALLWVLAAPAGAQSAYEAALPADIATNPDLCSLVPCQDVLPGATRFSQRMGSPFYVEGYRERADDDDDDDEEHHGTDRKEHEKLVGYVVLSTDVTDTPAYSGKPVITLIGIDAKGAYTGVKILKHSEPILLLGIPESALTNFNNQYLGKHISDQLEIGRSRPEENIIGLDAISGATVTVIAQNQVMGLSGHAVGRQVGLLEAVIRPEQNFVDQGRTPDWATLVAEGAVQRLVVTPEQVGLPPSPDPFIELWFGDLSHPETGRAVLGENGWKDLKSRIGEHDHAIFVIRTGGRESFKGSGFVRGGIYDRVQVRQEHDVFTFRDTHYLNLYGVQAAGAPAFNESGIFIIRDESFSSAFPWHFVFLGNRIDDASTGARSFASFDQQYWLADSYLEGGRPKIVKPDAPWVRVWKTRAVEIVLFSALLLFTAGLWARRDSLTRKATRKNKWAVDRYKYAIWLLSVFFIGFYLMAQPSITQVLTWFHALLFQWQWELFLTDPFIFLFWIFIIVTTFIWGRGLFCGWLCPFGSLQELLNKLGGYIGLKRFQFLLPMPLHDKLKWLKYGIFFFLLAVSMFSMVQAERMAEVEPFKTTFLVGIFNRSWPFTLYVAVLLGLSLLTERPFCKYLCPLGGALAMPSTFRWFGLRRKQECTTCKACAAGCGSNAIDADGRIDHRECMHCLDCMVLYTDPGACPPLAQEKRRRTKAGLPLTPIGHDGYYIPIKAVPAAAAQEA